MALYSPGIAFFVAGTVAILVFPGFPASGGCSGGSGSVPPCVSRAELFNPLALFLFIIGGIYSLVVFIVRDARRAKRRAPPLGSQYI